MYFVCGVITSTHVILYINGEEVSSTTHDGTSYADTGADLFIGGDGGNRNSGVEIDEVRVYSEALTAQEIKALYLNPGGQKAPIPGATVGAIWGTNIENEPSSLADLDTNADGVINNLDNAAYFPGTMNFNPTGGVLNSSGKPAGWFRIRNLSGINPISYDASEEALSIDSDVTTTVAAGCAAFPVLPNVTYKLKIKFRTLSAHANGLYVRILELDTELPNGKYAVGYTTGDQDPEVETATRVIQTWLEDVATTTSYQEEEFEYTPTSTAKWVSIGIWNWVGIGTDTLYVKYLTVVNQATDDSDIRHSSDTTKIDGGKIHADSQITIGNTVDGDYCQIDDGDIEFYYYKSGAGHVLYKSLKRRESGVAVNGDVVTIPGYFYNKPTVNVTPNQIQTYSTALATYNVNQILKCYGSDPVETSAGSLVWQFTVSALLVASGTATYSDSIADKSGSVNNTWVYTSQTLVGTLNTASETSRVNTTQLKTSLTSQFTALESGSTTWLRTIIDLIVTSGDTGTYNLSDTSTIVNSPFGPYTYTKTLTNKITNLTSGTHTYYFRIRHYSRYTWGPTVDDYQWSVTNINVGYTFSPDAQVAAGDVNWTAIGD